MADGGGNGGFSLFLKDGKPTYTYNFFRRRITTIEAPAALPPGPAKIVLKFDYDGGGHGKGAIATLYVNDARLARCACRRRYSMAFSFEDTFDIGEDSASPVGDYQSPFPFTGGLERVDLEIAPDN